MKPWIKIVSFLDFPFAVLLAHVIASKVLNIYRIYPNMDIASHYLGGLSIAYSATKIIRYLEQQRVLVNPLNNVVFPVVLVSLTATAAVFWEFAEFSMDLLLSTNVQISLANTMQDQFMGILGGLTWATICVRKFMKTSANETLS